MIKGCNAIGKVTNEFKEDGQELVLMGKEKKKKTLETIRESSPCRGDVHLTKKK